VVGVVREVAVGMAVAPVVVVVVVDVAVDEYLNLFFETGLKNTIS